ncbi:hypothetical protein LSAT2_010169, partial [Lamellibrachia satsuma]
VEIRYPTKNLKGEAVKRALAARLVAPVRAFGDHVRAFRVVWRVDNDGLAHAWDAILSQRQLCDQVVAQIPTLQIEVKVIKSLRNKQDDSQTADCGTLFIALKDHNSGYIYQKISRSLQAEGGVCYTSQHTNATLSVPTHSKYLEQLTTSVDQLRAAGLSIHLQVLERN